jgi:hypothetical protein
MREGKRVTELIEQHRVFLERGDTARPLFTVRRDRDSRPPPTWAETLGEGALVAAGDINIQNAMDWLQMCVEEDAQVPDDGFMPAAPWFSIPWMEAILGCPVRVYPTTLYAEPIINSPSDLTGIDFSLDTPWFEKLIDLSLAVVQRFGTQFPVCSAQLRGPLDMMSSLLGSQRLCLAMCDHPQEVQDLASRCATLWIEVAKAQLEIVPSYGDGYFNRLQIWTPGTTVPGHIDFASLISRQMFEEFAAAAERRIVDSFEYPIYHTHASSIHVIDDLAAMDNVAAIQVSLDRSVSRDELLNTLRMVQERKPVIVHRLKRKDLNEFVEALSPRGLCLCMVAETLDQAQEWIAWARNEWPDEYG